MDISQLYFFDKSEMSARGERYAVDYAAAVPFPSIILDDFLPKEVAEQIAKEFPGAEEGSFKKPENPFQSGKRESVQEGGFKGVSPYLRHFLNELNSHAFIAFLEKLTGIEGLIPDPSLSGAGLHQILPGGKLAIHADFNLDPYRKLQRRVNVLLYFNPDWDEGYGGHLELWDSKMKNCVKKISPILNRCVIFSTSKTSFHGHPDPLRCPENRTRNSIALYYYTGLNASKLPEEHTTLWKTRPGTREPSGEGNRVHGGKGFEFLRSAAKWTYRRIATTLESNQPSSPKQ